MRTVAHVALLGLCLVSGATGFGVKIDAHEEMCFFETVVVDTKLSLAFQVAEGGFLDIDVTIKGPDDKVIYSGERETDGKYTFSAHVDGKYEYCFSNQMSTMTPKLVVFTMVVNGGVSGAPGDAEESDTKHDKLHEMVRELSESLYNIRREQNQMEYREATHRTINDSTNSRVVWWSFFEALVLVCMSLGQVYYLNRFFEVLHTK